MTLKDLTVEKKAWNAVTVTDMDRYTLTEYLSVFTIADNDPLPVSRPSCLHTMCFVAELVSDPLRPRWYHLYPPCFLAHEMSSRLIVRADVNSWVNELSGPWRTHVPNLKGSQLLRLLYWSFDVIYACMPFTPEERKDAYALIRHLKKANERAHCAKFTEPPLPLCGGVGREWSTGQPWRDPIEVWAAKYMQERDRYRELYNKYKEVEHDDKITAHGQP